MAWTSKAIRDAQKNGTDAKAQQQAKSDADYRRLQAEARRKARGQG